METLNPASIFVNSNWLMLKKCSSVSSNSRSSSRSRWTKEENKIFESGLAIVDERTPDRWYRVAAMIPGKSVFQVIHHYNQLLADVSNIESGFLDTDPGSDSFQHFIKPTFTLDLIHNPRFDYGCRNRGRSFDQDRKKGIPWTEEEHRRFLMGLQAHGKGDWRNISRNYVISKTPTQVASHTQKYFLRQTSGKKDKKRPSIHDISTVNLVTDSNSNSKDEELLMVFNSTHYNQSMGSLFSNYNSNSPKYVHG